MADRVLVTGISGFVGGHVALQLLEKGYRVLGSIRSPHKADRVRRALEAAGADTSQLDFCQLDLLSDEGWLEAARSCTYLQHIASPFVLTIPKDKTVLIRPAVEGARRALNAALDAGHKRMVMTSSLAAIDGGHANYMRTLGADDWTNPAGAMVNGYAQSKTLAEREAWRLTRDRGRSADFAVINPGTILGPLLDEDPGTSGTVVQRLLLGKIPLAPDIRLSYVDVRDVAAAHVAAMTTVSAGGQRHLLSNPVWSIRKLAAALADGLPERQSALPTRVMPNWVARSLGIFDRSVGDSRAYLGIERRYDASSGIALLGRRLRISGEAAVAMGRSMIALGVA